MKIISLTGEQYADLLAILSRGEEDLSNYLADTDPVKDGYSPQEIENLYRLSLESSYRQPVEAAVDVPEIEPEEWQKESWRQAVFEERTEMGLHEWVDTYERDI